ncbi:lysylphosphatidylglycerol synthase domain-containing protein [Cellulomonas triticagri]|uniref:Uncharacterized protein n=1 Tax=Cellulomonas triticagri TaxID=2483352 RepID=A0A3M2JLV7_9CELL|nr:lysylphosphatidylglycerol synthase domain-containing protein [Cellulomonas triticagri]RMI13246.1 hypothetical protein EBM89_05330 [Cellulomonas triticagri]
MAEQVRRRRTWLRVLVALVVGVLVFRLVAQLVGRVDWTAVAAALGRLDPWVALPLTAALLARQVLNAVPLTRFLPGLGLVRSTQNDLTANLVATVAPPPADIAVRVAMFRSWRLDPVLGMAGVTLNAVQFYAVRFAVPALGLALLAAHGLEGRHWLIGGACAVAAVLVLVLLAVVLRSERLALGVGTVAGRLARRVRPGVDPATWAARVVDLRNQTASSMRTGTVPSLVALTGMVLADATVLLLAVRFVGVPADVLPATLVVGVLLLLYPLTILPLFGFGVLDALLLAWYVGAGGAAVEPEVVAATVVWRVVTILGTLLLGALALGVWRWRARP